MVVYKINAFGDLDKKAKFVKLLKVGGIYLKGKLFDDFIRYTNRKKYKINE